MNELELFAAAIAIADPGERASLLDRECASRPDVRQRIDQLLDAHFKSQPLLDQKGAEQTRAYVPGEEPGTIIGGRYKLLEEIGEGGMGTVWVAEQTEPVKRKVALKLIKPGMDSKSVLARFEAERQALAVMDHPNIAKVLDGGLAETGRPFFVMEYVKGVPITQYCDATRLSVQERLQLFAQVCSAVQHAHHKGIIHRDLKPSNILVAPYDDKPVPKVIDFGLAKAMHQALTERTLHTAHETVLGTPLYMSPEQAQLNNLDVDTRSDIYSLGVLLYELLTGTTPLEKQRFKQAAWDEIRRIIREEEPPRPSTRLSSTRTLPSLAACRQTEPLKLTKQVRGELDWIVMKALEKDRTRRYETANGLGMDIQRYLAGEPVLAVPPSATYRLRKFGRKHKAALTTAAVLFLTLVTGVGITTWQAIRAARAEAAARQAAMEAMAAQQAERERAEGERAAKLQAERAAEAEKKAREIAQAREAESKAVLDFVENKVFAAARPQGQEGGLGHDVTLRKAVDTALPFVNKSFTNQPLIEARLRLTLGVSFAYLGEANTAAEQFGIARVLFTKHLGPDHPDTLTSMTSLANSCEAVGRVHDAVKLQEEAFRIRKATLGPNHPDTLASMSNLAASLTAAGNTVNALMLFEETLRLRRAKLGLDHPDTLASMNNLALSYAAAGRTQEALTLNEETLQLRKVNLGPYHPDTLISMNNLATSYEAVGRNQEALKLREKTLQLRKINLGPDHPDTLLSMNNLANSHLATGRTQEALSLLEETLQIQKTKLGPDHPDTLGSMHNLANSYAAAGRAQEALKLREETVQLRNAKLGRDHPATLMSMNNLANSLNAAGRTQEALKLYEETLRREKAKRGADHPDTLLCMNNLATSYVAAGRTQDALKLHEDTLRLMKAKLGHDHPHTLISMCNLAWLLATAADNQLRDPKRAVELATEAAEKSSRNATYRSTLGVARYRTGDWKGAVADLEQAISLGKPNDPANTDSGFFLAMAHWQLGAKDKAREWFARSVAWMDKGKKDDPELKRFRTEAEELLGVKDKP